MNHKKSMRIFWLSLCLLLVSGIIIIAVVQYRSHKREMKELSMEEAENKPLPTLETGTDSDTKTDDKDATTRQGINSRIQQEDSPSDTQVWAPSGHAANYRFELKIVNGYLDVYHYHTENLFFHTGIPYRVLTLEQRQELQNGKYFLSEEELYGYLESCTS